MAKKKQNANVEFGMRVAQEGKKAAQAAPHISPRREGTMIRLVSLRAEAIKEAVQQFYGGCEEN